MSELILLCIKLNNVIDVFSSRRTKFEHESKNISMMSCLQIRLFLWLVYCLKDNFNTHERINFSCNYQNSSSDFSEITKATTHTFINQEQNKRVLSKWFYHQLKIINIFSQSFWNNDTNSKCLCILEYNLTNES